MRKAERLFQFIQILPRPTRLLTAARIAEKLEVSRRTVYRDTTDLVGERVPIVGEAGFGFPQRVRGRGAFMLCPCAKGHEEPRRGGCL